MTNYIPGFSLNGRHSSEFGILLSAKKTVLLPETRDIEQVVIGRPGVLDYRTEHGKRAFSLDLTFVGNTRAEILANVHAFAVVADPTQGYVPLIFDDEPDRYWLVKVTGTSEIQWQPALALVTVTLKMTDPYAYALDLVQQQMIIASSPQDSIIENAGNVATPVQLVIKNQGTTPINGFTLTRYQID